MDTFEIEIEPGLLADSAGDLTLEVLALDRLQIGIGHRWLDVLRPRMVARLRHDPSAALARTRPYRTWLRRLSGVDPTVPSRAEADIRSLLDRAPFPVVNDLVDVLAAVAIFEGTPILAVDRDRAHSPVTLRRAADSLPHVPAGSPILVDADGRVLDAVQDLGIPRTIACETRRALVIQVVSAKDAGDRLGAPRRRLANWISALLPTAASDLVVGSGDQDRQELAHVDRGTRTPRIR